MSDSYSKTPPGRVVGEGLRVNTLEEEVRLTTRIRQCFRALEVRDELAVGDEVYLVIQRLQVFLDYLLESDPSWCSKERWFDDMIHVQHELIPPGRFRISGELVWGMMDDAGGPQWAAPFFADVKITGGRSDTESYCIRFGRREEDSRRVGFGYYSGPGDPVHTIADPWSGRADWKYEFVKNYSTSEGLANR